MNRPERQPLLPNYCVLDQFLDERGLDEARRYACDNRDRFKPSEVQNEGASAYSASARHSLRRSVADNELPSFRAAIGAATPQLFRSLGIPPQQLSHHELEMVAHGDGAFFGPHLDTLTGINREGGRSDRLVSTVFYFTLGPPGFTGGELVLFPFGAGTEPAAIDPVPNRLVAFPSFAAHEVRRVTVPEDSFENARFAVNCWLHRARADA